MSIKGVLKPWLKDPLTPSYCPHLFSIPSDPSTTHTHTLTVTHAQHTWSHTGLEMQKHEAITPLTALAGKTQLICGGSCLVWLNNVNLYFIRIWYLYALNYLYFLWILMMTYIYAKNKNCFGIVFLPICIFKEVTYTVLKKNRFWDQCIALSDAYLISDIFQFSLCWMTQDWPVYSLHPVEKQKKFGYLNELS